MIVEYLLLVLLGWNVILTYRFIKMEIKSQDDASLCQSRIIQLMARTNMLKMEGKRISKKEAIKFADDTFNFLHGNDDDEKS